MKVSISMRAYCRDLRGDCPRSNTRARGRSGPHYRKVQVRMSPESLRFTCHGSDIIMGKGRTATNGRLS